MKKDVEAFNFKSGPTESGLPKPKNIAVGGEVLSIDKLSVFLSQYWLLLLLIIIPFAYLLYKKRQTLPPVLFKTQARLLRFITRI